MPDSWLLLSCFALKIIHCHITSRCRHTQQTPKNFSQPATCLSCLTACLYALSPPHSCCRAVPPTFTHSAPTFTQAPQGLCSCCCSVLPHPFSCHAAAHACARAGDSDCAMVKGEPYTRHTMYNIHILLSGHFQQKNIFNSLFLYYWLLSS